MPAFTALLWLLVIILSNLVESKYNVDDSWENPNVIQFRRYAATFVRNNVIYAVGGDPRDSTPLGVNDGHVQVTRRFDAIGLDLESGNITYTDMGGYECDLCRNSAKAVYLPESDRALFFGGFSQIDNSIDNTTLFVGEYSFQTSSWKTLMENQPMPNFIDDQNSTIPRNTNNLTATLAPNGNIYLRFKTKKLGEPISLWSYNTSANTITRVNAAPTNDEFINSSQFVAIALPDGRIVYINNVGYATVVDTNTNQFTVQSLDGADDDDYMTLLLERVQGYPFLVPGNSRYIYYYGGYGQQTYYRRIYSNDLTALDTETWTWVQVPVNKEVTPRMRGGTTVGLLYDQYLIITHGVSAFSWYNGFDVLKIPQSFSPNSTGEATWVANIKDPENKALDPSANQSPFNKELGTAAIAGIAVGVAAFICIVLLVCWYFSRNFITSAFYYFIWEPRVGEPLWVEFLHLVTKAILTGLFIAYLVYNIILVLHSPVTQWRIAEPIDYVALPDIRFCLEGVKRSSSVDCETESISALDCDNMNVIDYLNDSLHEPYSSSDYRDRMECVLFSPGDKMQISRIQAQTSNNGRVRFMYKRLDQVTPSLEAQQEFRVHIELYPPGKNPNLVVYNDTKQPYLTESELDTWKYSDQNALQRPNTYTLEYGQYGSIRYQLQEHSYLTNSSWNNFGFAQTYSNMPEITTTFKSTNDGSSRNNFVDVSTVHTLDVYPASYERVILQDRKIYTFVSVLGSAGGLLSLLIVLNALLYGYRPKSPWGVVHRFSMGPLRQSLHKKLYQTFGFMGRPITFVDSVNNRLYRDDVSSPISQSMPMNDVNNSEKGDFSTGVSTSISLEQRMAQMEKRLQQMDSMERRFNLMEVVFKEYYTNNEVFQHLALAHGELFSNSSEGHKNTRQSQDGHSSDSADNQQPQGLFNLMKRRKRSKDGRGISTSDSASTDIETATSQSKLLKGQDM